MQQFVFRMLADIGQRALTHESDRAGIGDAQVAARRTKAVATGGKIVRVFLEAIARQEELEDVAPILGGNSALAQQRRDFIDL